MTTPLIAYDSAGGRRLLVAGGLGWSTGSGSLAVPSPLAATTAAGGWRSAPSSPFALEELDAGDIRYFEHLSQPDRRHRPQRQRSRRAGDDPRRHRRRSRLHPARARRADRRRTSPRRPGSGGRRRGRGPLVPGHVARCGAMGGSPSCPRRRPARPGRIPAPPGSPCPSPARPRRTRRPATPEIRETRGRADARSRLAGRRFQLNGYGEASPISFGRVAVDRTGPNVVVDAPFLSAPWPFSAPIRGTTERGTRVRLGGGPFVERPPPAPSSSGPSWRPGRRTC